jgi:hypothetical protein
MKNYFFDLIVVGAGSAGIAAACTAARSGSRVALIEKNPFAGGRATDAFVGTICGLYFRNEKEEFSYCGSGFMAEFAEKLKKYSGTKPIAGKNGLKFLPYKLSQFMLLSDDLLATSKVSVFYNSTVVGIDFKGNRIEGFKVFQNNQILNFNSIYFADCSGSDLVHSLAGVAPILDDVYQQSHYSVLFSRISSTNLNELKLELVYALSKANESREIEPFLTFTTLIPGQDLIDGVWLKIPLFEIIEDYNSNSKTEVQARNNSREVLRVLRKYGKSFGKSEILQSAFDVGQRTGTRNKGVEILTKEDVLNCKKIHHSGVIGTWPLETWTAGRPVDLVFFPEDDYFSIPKDCLKSAHFENLFFAGRNISADSGAISSARVIGTCLQMGEAAGNLIF